MFVLISSLWVPRSAKQSDPGFLIQLLCLLSQGPGSSTSFILPHKKIERQPPRSIWGRAGHTKCTVHFDGAKRKKVKTLLVIAGEAAV